MRQRFQAARAWLRDSESVVARWSRAARAALLGEMPVLAAGTALYAIFAIVPTLAAVVAVYGFVADPTVLEHRLTDLGSVIPRPVVSMLRSQLERQAAAGGSEFRIALGVTVGLAVISARGAARALIDTLNRAYRVREQRKLWLKLRVTIALGALTVVGVLVLLLLVVALPAVVGMFGITGYDDVDWVRWPALVLVIFFGLMPLYRYAPSPRPLGTERHLWPGALAGTLLLLGASFGLALWVSHGAGTDRFYGAFGSVVVVLLWFYLSVLAITFGGFVNAELERHSGAPAPDRSMY